MTGDSWQLTCVTRRLTRMTRRLTSRLTRRVTRRWEILVFWNDIDAGHVSLQSKWSEWEFCWLEKKVLSCSSIRSRGAPLLQEYPFFPFKPLFLPSLLHRSNSLMLKSHFDSTHSLPLSSLCWWQLGRHCLPRLARPAAAWLDEAACLATPARAQQLTQTRAQPQPALLLAWARKSNGKTGNWKGNGPTFKFDQ